MGVEQERHPPTPVTVVKTVALTLVMSGRCLTMQECANIPGLLVSTRNTSVLDSNCS